MNIRCYFPSVLRHVAPFNEGNGHRHNLQIRVPVDDFHTQVFRVNFVPSETESRPRTRRCRFVSRRSRPDRASTR